MPSIAYNPYSAVVTEAPALGAFADMWNVRQESDMILEEDLKTQKSRLDNIAETAERPEGELPHTVKVAVHNPYSMRNPVTTVFVCHCDACEPRGLQEGTLPGEYYEEVSRFMPPPPPRMDTYDVIMACGAHDPDTAVYEMMMRWFRKTSNAQHQFPIDDQCPGPNPEGYDFAQWCERANGWWRRNFEHMQRKRAGHRAPHSRNAHVRR
jgi:hypothetical protein